MHYDVFNGDADGIISLLQLRLNEPLQSELITGVKRDIALLSNIECQAGDSVTVLDISMEKNNASLRKILSLGCPVFYADHHRFGSLPKHKHLTSLLDLDADTCTALIIDKHLAGKYHAWAICAAYGDNLFSKANQLARQAGYSEKQQQGLLELGTLINYNSYGKSEEDLHFSPAELYRLLLAYPSPFDVIDDLSSPFWQLQSVYQSDLSRALAISVRYESKYLRIFDLPDEAWSRRISGVYSNLLVNQVADKACIVLIKNSDSSYLVSLRSPLNNKQGAGEICSLFATGGGRASAAGINELPQSDLDKLIKRVEVEYA